MDLHDFLKQVIVQDLKRTKQDVSKFENELKQQWIESLEDLIECLEDPWARTQLQQDVKRPARLWLHLIQALQLSGLLEPHNLRARKKVNIIEGKGTSLDSAAGKNLRPRYESDPGLDMHTAFQHHQQQHQKKKGMFAKLGLKKASSPAEIDTSYHEPLHDDDDGEDRVSNLTDGSPAPFSPRSAGLQSIPSERELCSPGLVDDDDVAGGEGGEAQRQLELDGDGGGSALLLRRHTSDEHTLRDAAAHPNSSEESGKKDRQRASMRRVSTADSTLGEGNRRRQSTRSTSPVGPRQRATSTATTLMWNTKEELIEKVFVQVWEYISHEKLTMARLWLTYFDQKNTQQVNREELRDGLIRIGLSLTDEELQILFHNLHGRYQGPSIRGSSAHADLITSDDFNDAAKMYRNIARKTLLQMEGGGSSSTSHSSTSRHPREASLSSSSAKKRRPPTRPAGLPQSTSSPSLSTEPPASVSTTRGNSTSPTRPRSPKNRRNHGGGNNNNNNSSQHQPEGFDLAKELDAIIGQEKLKSQLVSFQHSIEMQARRRELGVQVEDQRAPHVMFLGNPGTGKTTIARLVGKILHNLGMLRYGHLVEVQRSDLVAGAIGQTALKTREKIEEAKGGILFVDEAYTLVPFGTGSGAKDFGQEAIQEIMKVMNDGDPVMIFAGYKQQMQDFVKANAGMFRRIDNIYDFENYTVQDIITILRLEVQKAGFSIDSAVSDEELRKMIEGATSYQQRGLMNGGLSQQLFKKARAKLDDSLSMESSLEEMCTLSYDHFYNAAEELALSPKAG